MPFKRRARQSRLTFTPLSSSSPVTEGYNKQVQDRAAAVGYVSPNAKRRKLDVDDELSGSQLEGANDHLPTPIATGQHDGNAFFSSDTSSEPIKSTQRPHRIKQQQLDFSRNRSSEIFDPPIQLSSSYQPRTTRGIFSSQAKRNVVGSDESSDENLSEDVRPRRTRKTAQRSIVIDSDEEDDATVVNSKPMPGGQDLNEEQDEEKEEEEEETMPTTAGKRSRKRRRPPDSFITSSPPTLFESDSDFDIISLPKRKHRRTDDQKGDDDDDDDENDDDDDTPTRRKTPHRRLTEQEQDDLAEDLEFLGPSSDNEALNRTPMTTQEKQRQARISALERLKRRRSRQNNSSQNADGGIPIGSDESPADDDTEIPATSHRLLTQEDDDIDFIASDEDGEDSTLGIPESMPIQFTPYASMKARELFKYAVEWMVQKKINPGFSMNDELYTLAFRKLNDEVQGLAGSKFMSAAWTPEFTFALQSRPCIAYEAIDRSSEWDTLEKCDACNRTNHPATFRVQFQGKPYDPQTLEEVTVPQGDDDEEDEEDSSSSRSSPSDIDNKPAYDATGREIPPASTIYYVGKFCMANAEIAHALSHWRYHLYEYVVDFLKSRGYLTDEKVVARDNRSTKKRRKEANKIVDRMEKDGEVKRLWREFRGNIDNARNAKQGRFSTGNSP